MMRGRDGKGERRTGQRSAALASIQHNILIASARIDRCHVERTCKPFLDCLALVHVDDALPLLDFGGGTLASALCLLFPFRQDQPADKSNQSLIRF